MLFDNQIVSWFADELHTDDLRRFKAKKGVSDFNTLWEALAILVAVRLWRKDEHQALRLEVRSDSLGALSAVNKLASPDPKLNSIARELALDCAFFYKEPDYFEHTPGVANVIPDHLSRLKAPTPSSFPSILNGVNETAVQTRDTLFWKSFKRPTDLK